MTLQKLYLWVFAFGTAIGGTAGLIEHASQDAPVRPSLTVTMDGSGNYRVRFRNRDLMVGTCRTANAEKFLWAGWPNKGQQYGALRQHRFTSAKRESVRWFDHVDETITLTAANDELLLTCVVSNRGTEPIRLLSCQLPPLLDGEPTWAAAETRHFARNLCPHGESWGGIYPCNSERIGGAYARWQPANRPAWSVGAALRFVQTDQWRFYLNLEWNPWPTTLESRLAVAVAREVLPGQSVAFESRWLVSAEHGQFLLRPHKEELFRNGDAREPWDGRTVLEGMDYNRVKAGQIVSPFTPDQLALRLSWLREAKQRNCKAYIGWAFAPMPWHEPWEWYPLRSDELDADSLLGLQLLAGEATPSFRFGWLLRPSAAPTWNAAGQRKLAAAGTPLWSGLLADSIPPVAYLDDAGLSQWQDGQRTRFDTPALLYLRRLKPGGHLTPEFSNDRLLAQGLGFFGWWSVDQVNGDPFGGHQVRDLAGGWRQMADLVWLMDGRLNGLVTSADSSTWGHAARRAIADRYRQSPLCNDYQADQLPRTPQTAPTPAP